MRRFLVSSSFAALVAMSGAAFAAPKQVLTAPRGPVNSHIPDFVRSGATAVRFNSDEMLNLGNGDEVELSLPNARRHSFVFELRLAHGNGIYSWVGYHKQRGTHNRAIVTTGPTGSFAVFSTPDGEYRLIPGNGNDWLIDMTAEAPFLDPIELGDDGLIPPVSKAAQSAPGVPETMVRIPGVNIVAVPKATPVPQNLVDIMFVYTNGLATTLGTDLMTRLNFLVTRANTAYADSEIAITLRLVGAAGVNYSDANSDSAALGAISPLEVTFDAATFGSIETLRNAAGADLVAFLRNGSSFGGSGLAWVGSSTPHLMAGYMYSVTTGCVLGCESVFIHELGHNMGNRHDRPTSAWQAGGTSSYGQGAYTYSFGYAFCNSGVLTCNPELPPGSGGCGSQPECNPDHANNFADIMAYFQGTTDKIYKFSNPNVTCAAPGGDGVPRACGINEALSNSANTAKSMNDHRANLSAIKSTVAADPLPGSIQFASTSAAAAESAGNLTFTVSRIGGSTGAVGATYTTSNGTAIAGADYVASSGTVSWANGDTANKTINVPLIANGAGASSTTFNLTLSNPTGPAGVFLGFPTAATGIILEPWPPGGTMPAGFVTPGTSAGAWTVATDQAYEGTHSLRSAQVLGIGDFTTYVNSDLTHTVTLATGTIGFAYRVSSYPNYGRFQFLVDGVVVYTDTGGESGWKFITHNVTAGSRTLTWRYANRLHFRCNTANPPPPGGGACEDRAWIDSLILPLPGVAPPPAVTLVKSRKTHSSGFGGTDHDVTINTATPIGGAVTTEPRAIGTGHVLLFQFDTTVTSIGTITCVDQAAAAVGSIASSGLGTNTIQVTLTGIPDNQRVTVTVPNVNGSGSGASASIGFLVGDVNGSRSVTASDILATKGRIGQGLSASTFVYDPNKNGAIDATDVSDVKSNAGLSM